MFLFLYFNVLNAYVYEFLFCMLLITLYGAIAIGLFRKST